MSPADASSLADTSSGLAGGARAIRPRLISTRFLRSELTMMFLRRRNQAILVVLAAIPVVIAIAVRLSGRGNGDGGDGNGPGGIFGNITDNGIFVGFAALVVVLPLFLPMAVSVVAGESVAGEANTGTLRYLLAVPVHRSRLLATKLASIVVWCIIGPVIVAVAGVIAGLSLFPHGSVVLLSGTETSQTSALWRLLLAVGYCALMMIVIGAIGLFVSTLTEVPIAAMASALALTITSEVLQAVPQLSSIHPWLFSDYWLDFADFLRDPVSYQQVTKGALVSLGYIVVFLSAAWARFGVKDVSS
jgi:ABC-2 type transport system permease protein